MTNSKVFVLLLLFLCLAAPQTSAQSTQGGSAFDEETYVKIISVARRAREAGGEGAARAANAAKDIDKLAVRPGAPGYAVIEVVRFRLFIRSRELDTAQAAVMQLLGSPAVSPECVLGLVEIHKDDTKVRTELEDCLAQLLPLSVWSQQANARQSRLSSDVKPPRPDIPSPNVKKMTQIAEAYEEARLPDKAWRAYIEAIYANAPSWVEGALREGAWLSQDSAELWRHAAENAWKAGDQLLAHDYLAKCAVFGSDQEFDRAKELLKKWRSGQDEKKLDIPKEQRQKIIEDIAKLYADINAHPRALDVIRTYRDWLKEPDVLYEKHAKEWTEVVKSYSRGAPDVVLYGTKLSAGTDPASIRIPPACTQESIKAAKQAVTELLKKAVESASRPGTMPSKAGDR